ncbi:NifB/NifX family molybdenum-iron cluster-binding protein [Vibrio sp. CAU 1672]|uniref:NifB/NifX family molybdenum-iron cluster-binding protein n=1 Tax=Vibrio sp. CAU 1672 TaxID=3032594 RepID=UPI0023DB5F1D|nr:NifB/NifX family molybdenum-iron cluster-binding protein [Vibrio sp. CAU 1672]MDF2152976.1 NifB/NifX family molybdenum-iron cluster-binding protein [Vibrio sp. CAU 1672]
MIYAIPNNGERIANHFIKAPYIAIYSDSEGLLHNLANQAGAPEAGCAAKSELLRTLDQYQVTHVLVRNIGERVLAKLLKRGKKVYRLNRGGVLSEALSLPSEALCDASQGRPSLKHKQKGGCGAGGCCGKSRQPALVMRPRQLTKRARGSMSPTILKFSDLQD